MFHPSSRAESDYLNIANILSNPGERMSIEEASKKIFDEIMMRFEHDTGMVFTTPEDSEALADMIGDWKRLGLKTLQKLSLNQPWNMPLYFALSSAILNRCEINELSRSLHK